MIESEPSDHGPERAILTKARLIDEVSRALDTTHKEAAAMVEAIFNRIVRALQQTDKVEIRGFGSFHIRQRRPRMGRNPKTGATVQVPSKKVPFFKPSKELRELVDGLRIPGEGEKDSE
jgi:integration host factor subunit beta